MLKTLLRNAVRSIPAAVWVARHFHSTGNGPQLSAEGREGVKSLGHRAYVGGLWDEIGKLQFDFLIGRGLRPHQYLLDIGCGSLRAGIHFIPYLDPGHYLGIEKEEALLEAGIQIELGADTYAEKRPEFVISSCFEFHKFSTRPHYALAQSLFTHLPAPSIHECLDKLRRFIRADGAFYATFNEVPVEVVNPIEAHDHANFQYTRRQMEQFAALHGWGAEYLGDWNHPRHQKMMYFRPV